MRPPSKPPSKHSAFCLLPSILKTRRLSSIIWKPPPPNTSRRTTHGKTYTDGVSKLIETLAAELERPRELSARVVNYIGGTYGIDYDAIGAFLVEKLPTLEDDELDLILSPVFTPKLNDQAVFAELLGRESV